MLDLSCVTVERGGMLAIAEALQNNTTLMALDFGIDIDAEGAQAMAEALKRNTTLRELHMSCVIGAEGAQAVAEALKRNTTLKEIQIQGKIKNAGAEALKSNVALLTPSLKEKKIDADGARSIAEALKSNATLKALKLNSNSIGAQGTRVLVEALKSNAALTDLDLGDNKIGDDGARVIADALKSNSALTELSLNQNNISAEGARAIAEALKSNATLTALDLWCNEISDAGARAIAEALKGNATLKKLNLSSNEIQQRGARTIAEALKSNATLTTLDLRGNYIGAGGARAIAEALKSNAALALLNLKFNEIGDDGARAIAEAVKSNFTLEDLDLGSNRIGDDGVRAIAEALKSNATLTALGLESNAIGDEGARAIAEALKSNATITELTVWNDQVGADGVRAITEALEGNRVVTECYLGHELPKPSSIQRNVARRARLHAAVKSGQLDEVRLLLQEGVDVMSVVDGVTVLHVAMDCRHWGVLDLLLRHPTTALFVKNGLERSRQHALIELRKLANEVPAFAVATRICAGMLVADTLAVESLVREAPAVRQALRRSPQWRQLAYMSTDTGLLTTLCACGANYELAPDGSVVSVDLCHRNLEALPPGLRHLPDTVELRVLEGNPLSSIPDADKKSGTPALLQYLRDIAKPAGKVAWPRAKVMVLGKEGVGKSHILHRLRARNAAYTNVSTNGISVDTLLLPRSKDVPPLELTWFDFAGQEVFYPTHQFFLTPQCIYLVVFRLDDADCVARVRYWLQMIAHFASDPGRPVKIVVVATFADRVQGKQEREAVWAQLQALLQRSRNVVATVVVSCTTGEGFDALRGAITLAAEKAHLDCKVVPAHYVRVWQWVRENRARQPQMEWSAFRAHFPALTDVQLEGACRFLSDAGQCVYSAPEELGLVVLDLQWLADLFSKVISHCTLVKDGVVTRERLQHAWKGASAAEVARNIALLERFEMAFPKLEEGAWVVPSMLKEEECVTTTTTLPALGGRQYERVYELDVVPAGLMGRLIVRLQAMPSVRVRDMWREGVVYGSVDGNEVGRAWLEWSELSLLRVQSVCAQEEGSSRERLVYQAVTAECGALLKSLFFRHGDEVPYRELVVCLHCHVTRLPLHTCVDVVLSSATHYTCGPEQQQVPVALLSVDVSFGNVHTFDAGAVQVEPQPFAAGAFGLISRATLVGEGTAVVVKELNPLRAKAFPAAKAAAEQAMTLDHDASVDALRRGFAEFQHEAELMSRLRHPNIVQLHGIMLSPLRLVLELCALGDLDSALKRQLLWKGPMPAVAPPICLKLALDIARGMAFLHSQSPPIAHRDLRSPNVFLVSLDPDADVCAKVADFGLSVVMTARQRDALSCWQWMAPEAQAGADYTEQCDLYSYAIVVNEIYTQEAPFIVEYEKPADPSVVPRASATMKRAEIMRAIVAADLRPSKPPHMPAWLRQLQEDMWQRDATQRPSFAECVYRIEHAGQMPMAAVAAAAVGMVPPRAHAAPMVRVVFEGVARAAVLSASSNGAEVWVGCHNGEVRVYSAANLRELRCEKHSGQVLAVCSASQGCSFSGSSDGTVLQWGGNPSKNPSSSKIVEVFSSLRDKKKKKKGGAAADRATEDAGRRVDVTQLVALNDVLLQGSTSHVLTVRSLDTNAVLAEHKLPNTVTCVCAVDGTLAWAAAGTNLYRVTASSVQLAVERAHERPVRALAYVGEGRVWSVTERGELAVWNAVSGQSVGPKMHLPGVARAWCLCLVSMRGRPTVWLGGVDEVRVYDAQTCVERCVLPLPRPGNVTCMVSGGDDVAWVGVRGADESGSLYVWDCTSIGV